MKEESRTYHEVANIFPMMSDVQYKQLKASVENDGQLMPIWLHPDGSIVDGRNRHRACVELDIAPKFKTWDGTGSLVNFVVMLNLLRRQMTKSQLAHAGVGIKEAFAAEIAEEKREKNRVDALRREREKREAERKAKEEAGQAAFITDDERETEQVCQLFDKPARDAKKEAATATGVNSAYIADAAKLKKEHPDLFDALEDGSKSLSQCKREAAKRERANAPPLPEPEGKYRVIYADPPWSYGNSGVIGETDNYGHVKRHYPDMTIKELCGLPVKSMAQDNSVLFMWVTSPLLAECFDVIKAWGFKYKTSFVWDKVGHNFGHYNSVRHELLLICTRGSCTPDHRKLIDSVQTIEKSKKHSEKPDEFRQIIDTLYTHGKRVELFSRADVDGWDAWGNE